MAVLKIEMVSIYIRGSTVGPPKYRAKPLCLDVPYILPAHNIPLNILL
jgi:hypothetical protein